ncbi:hypothetical protein JOF48_000635 [Arthrobacter stackebrandtii]|uniref:Uncharacterized protein n=1 Tax=Arthrobacter stackebrandtii TaxID=272161 RepID=A0ABS4YSQ8_9MICC|nr:hypothetical protein [Arthrobacter stackebrandtii]MBP2411836.1 hypothetical protein [Arthrobacter stackebrandtii]
MGPDPKQRREAKKARQPTAASGVPAAAPNADDEHAIAYFQRHVLDDPNETSPGRVFLRSCPPKTRAKLSSILVAVAAAPPRRFSGGGYWEAMHGTMAGWFEIRVDGPNRHHYRLFCQLDYEASGISKPLLVVIDGRDKPFRTALAESDYTRIRAYGHEYYKRNPRSII